MKTVLLFTVILISACTAFNNTGEKGIRSFSSAAQDEMIETKVINLIQQSGSQLESAHIQVHSFNQLVLITGQAPNEHHKQLITSAAKKVHHIKRIYNEVRVKSNTSIFTRTNDHILLAKIKARFVGANNVPADRIDIIVEDGTVYLMGMVTQQEGNFASNAAKQASGIKKIVKVFEYIH